MWSKHLSYPFLLPFPRLQYTGKEVTEEVRSDLGLLSEIQEQLAFGKSDFQNCVA